MRLLVLYFLIPTTAGGVAFKCIEVNTASFDAGDPEQSTEVAVVPPLPCQHLSL